MRPGAGGGDRTSTWCAAEALRGQQSGKLHSIIVKAEGVDISSAELATIAEVIEDRTGRSGTIG